MGDTPVFIWGYDDFHNFLAVCVEFVVEVTSDVAPLGRREVSVSAEASVSRVER